MRKCSKCGVEKPFTDFYVTRRDQQTGEPVTWKRQCKLCMKRKADTWRRARPTEPVDREGGTMLPIAPFREWLLARLDEHEGVRGRLADELKTSDRRLYAWLNVSNSVHIDEVDRAVMEAGWMLRDVYPDLYVFGPRRAINRTQRRAEQVSSYRGVGWDSHAKKWSARVCINGQRFRLGMFTDEEAAARAVAEFLEGCDDAGVAA